MKPKALPKFTPTEHTFWPLLEKEVAAYAPEENIEEVPSFTSQQILPHRVTPVDFEL